MDYFPKRQYALVLKTARGGTNDALRHLDGLPLDGTSLVYAHPVFTGEAADGEFIQGGAVVKVVFRAGTSARFGTPLLDAADHLALKHFNAEPLPFKVALYCMEGDCAGVRHNLEQWGFVSKVEILERMAALPQQIAALEAALAVPMDGVSADILECDLARLRRRQEAIAKSR